MKNPIGIPTSIRTRPRSLYSPPPPRRRRRRLRGLPPRASANDSSGTRNRAARVIAPPSIDDALSRGRPTRTPALARGYLTRPSRLTTAALTTFSLKYAVRLLARRRARRQFRASRGSGGGDDGREGSGRVRREGGGRERCKNADISNKASEEPGVVN
jgi:hypothetical protein